MNGIPAAPEPRRCPRANIPPALASLLWKGSGMMETTLELLFLFPYTEANFWLLWY